MLCWVCSHGLGFGALDRALPVIMEPVDDGAGLQVELCGKLLDRFW